jgi:hypothetical protein
VLAVVVVQTTRLVSLAFSRFDPCYALFRFWTGEVYPSALVTLGAVCEASLLVERPWCRWFCPFGVLRGPVQLLSPWKIGLAAKTCASCVASCGGGLTHSIPLGNRLSIIKGLAAGMLFLALITGPTIFAIATGKMTRVVEVGHTARSDARVLD